LEEKDAVASTQVQLARLSLEENKPSAAELLVRKTIPAAKSADTGDAAALAHTVLAEVLLSQNKISEAQHESVLAMKLAGQTQVRQIKWQTQLVHARVEASTGNAAAALATIQQVEAQAGKLGLNRISLNARLALSQLQSKKRGAAQFQSLEHDAREKGFVRIANKAQKALQ
jgi:hypothetical protein